MVQKFCIDCGVSPKVSRNRCDPCRKAHRNAISRAWKRANPERVRASKKRNYDSAKAVAYTTKWRQENLQRSQDYQREYKARNRGAFRIWWSAYFEANKERIYRYAREYKRAHPEKYSPGRRRYTARKYGANGSHSEAEWQAVVKKQRGRCIHCKLRTELTRDHIVPLIKGGSDYIVNIQGLCRSCNSRKRDSINGIRQFSLFDKSA